MTETPTLYVTQGSGNNIKPMLVAHQLGLSCHVRYVNVLAGESRTPEFLKINPLGVVPYMTLPDGTGLGESNAIAWYLAEGSALMPDTALSRAQAVAWMNFEQTRLEANISPVRFFTYIVPDLEKDHADMIPVWRERGAAGLALLDDYLQQREFITDYGYSVADIAVFGYTHLANEGGFNLGDYPAISAWISRVEAQPGYRPINELLDGNDTQLSRAA
jgi:glutathione S-transferase